MCMMIGAVITAIWKARGSGTPAPIWTMIGIVSATALVMLAVIFVTLRIGRKKKGGRKLAVRSFAESAGFDYLEKCDSAFGKTVKTIPGISPKATNRHKLTGTVIDRAFLAFENTYMTFTGQVTIPVNHTVYTLAAPGNWSSITVSPRTQFARLARRFGFPRGLELESSQFNTMFKVKTNDQDFAIALLSPELQRFLLEKTNVTWHVEPSRVALIYAGPMKPDRIEPSLARLERFWTLIADELKAA